jgi:hypothetical protein
MAANAKNLTHDEIWDDSALIESWNQALDEYKVRPPELSTGVGAVSGFNDR